LQQIVRVQDNAGTQLDRIVIRGGAGQFDIVRQILADGIGRPVFASAAAEPVLLGSANPGAVAAMSRQDAEHQPNKEASKPHDCRFITFCARQFGIPEPPLAR
jgi:D-ribulokinase